MLKVLPRNSKTVVFTLNVDMLFRDNDGMGRYAYVTLNAFSESGYSVYLCKTIDTFDKYMRLGRYGRLIYSIKNLKIVNEVPRSVNSEDAIYAFDSIVPDLLKRPWRKIVFVNMFKPSACQIGDMVWLPYFVHPVVYKNGVHKKFALLRGQKRNLRVFFAGNTVSGYYSHPRMWNNYKKIPRREGIEALLELVPQVSSVKNVKEFLQEIGNGKYVNEARLVRTNEIRGLGVSQYWQAMSRSDFFICLPGTDLPMCHNAIEALAAGTIPIIGYADWFYPPLEHGKNAVVFSDKDDLKVKVLEVMQMPPDKIAKMREAAAEYYDKYLACGSFVRGIEEHPQRIFTLMMHPRQVSKPEVLEDGQRLMQEIISAVNPETPQRETV